MILVITMMTRRYFKDVVLYSGTLNLNLITQNYWAVE